MNKFYDSLFGKNAFLTHLSAIFHPIKFFKCLRYPFIKIYNRWDNKFMGYAYTEDESIALGWRKAFGKDLLKDIKKAGKLTRKNAHKHYKWKDMIQFQEIKEKWGELVLDASATEEIQEVLDKYEYISIFFCPYCGKPTRYCTKGWIAFLCEDCFTKDCIIYDFETKKYVPVSKEKLEELKQKCVLSREKDIPTVTRFNKDDIVKVDVEKEYDIDLKELTRYWND